MARIAFVGCVPPHTLTSRIYRAGAQMMQVLSSLPVAMYLPSGEKKERKTRFELATPTLARLCSTTELLPLKARWHCADMDYISFPAGVQHTLGIRRMARFFGEAPITHADSCTAKPKKELGR